MVRCPSTWDQRGLLENGYPLGGYQVFAGTSEWDRMEATPVRWISARRAGIAAPQAYVFHRSSRRAGIRIHSLVLEEMGSKTDRRSIQSSQRPFGALRLARNEKRPLLAVTPCGAHASFVEESLGTDHIGVAWVDGQGVRPCRLSLHDPLDLVLSHPHHLPEKVLGSLRPVDDDVTQRCLQSSSRR
jgi:hypothetical protein